MKPMSTGSKVFWGVIAALIIYMLVKPKPPEKPIPPLDYMKMVYTADHAIVCPMSLLSDPRADHDAMAVYDLLHLTMFNAQGKAEKLGCEVLRGGIEVTAVPMGGSDNYVALNGDTFTADIYLTNNADGSWRSADSTNAKSESSRATVNNSLSLGQTVVTTPSGKPIPNGRVEISSDSFLGAVVCPDSNTFANVDDTFAQWLTSNNSPNETSAAEQATVAEFKELAQSHGCIYLEPGTQLTSEGGNQVGSMAIVNVQLQDGSIFRGVTIPTAIQPSHQQVQEPDPSMATAKPESTE